MTSDALTDLEVPANVSLAPGAMQHWSDLEHAPAAGSAAVAELIGRLLPANGTVLVAGPHSPELIAAVTARAARTTVVVRSLVDAVTIGRMAGSTDASTYGSTDIAELEVICGDLSELAGRRFDCVIALDDVTRLLSLESDPLTWQQAFEVLRAAAGDSGRLLLAVRNPISAERLAAGQEPAAADTDSDWSPLATFDSSRPATAAQLTERCAAAGLAATAWTAFPGWTAPTVLSSAIDCLDTAGRSLLAMLVLRASATESGDPGWIWRAAATAGRLAELAAGWIAVCGPPTDREGNFDEVLDGSTGELVGYRATGKPGGAAMVQQIANRRRTLTGLANSALLSELLLAACVRADLPEIRSLLRSYAEGLVRGEPKAYASASRLDNVLVGEHGRLSLLVAGEAKLPAASATTDGLVDLITRLRVSGLRHPWPATIDDASWISVLAAMAEVELPEGDVVRGRRRLHDLEVAQDAWLPAAVRARLAQLEVRCAELESRAGWFENRLNHRERENQALTDDHARAVASSAAAIRQRDAQVEALRGEIARLRSSVSYRVGKKALEPARQARRLMQRFRP